MPEIAEEVNNLLEKLYYNPRTGFSGPERLLERAHEIDPQITRKEVLDFMKDQETVQLHKPIQVTKDKFLPIVGQPGNWSCDLVFYDKPVWRKRNSNYGIILVFVETTSRYAVMYPMKTKQGPEVIENYKKFLELKWPECQPSTMLSDNGKEFIQKKWYELNTQHGITQIFADKDDHSHMGILNRFIRTIREKIGRFCTARNSLRWVDALPDLVENYNNEINRTIGCTPTVALDPKVANFIRHMLALKGESVILKMRQFGTGQQVRVMAPRVVLNGIGEKKSGAITYNKGLYTIVGKKQSKFVVQNEEGKTLDKAYKFYELQKVDTVKKAPKEAPPPDGAAVPQMYDIQDDIKQDILERPLVRLEKELAERGSELPGLKPKAEKRQRVAPTRLFPGGR